MFFGEYTLDQGCEVELSASEVCLYMEDVIGMSDLSEQGLGSVSGYALNCAVSDWTRRGHSGAESFANANDWNGDKLREVGYYWSGRPQNVRTRMVKAGLSLGNPANESPWNATALRNRLRKSKACKRNRAMFFKRYIKGLERC